VLVTGDLFSSLVFQVGILVNRPRAAEGAAARGVALFQVLRVVLERRGSRTP
jgi:hypothetical protein